MGRTTGGESEPRNGCGGRHLKWAAAILTVSLGCLLVVVTIGAGAIGGQATRLREVELKEAATQVQYQAIQKSLDEIKADVKELRKRRGG